MHFSRDMLLQDTALLSSLRSNRPIRRYTCDDFATFDAATADSLGAFLVGQLERLDQKEHAPLVSVTWSRDVPLREDVTAADEHSSFTNSTYAATGGIRPNGKAWAGKDVNTIPGVALDIARTVNPLTLWMMELSFTLPELASAKALGRPIDDQKYNAIMLKHQMDIDEQVYIGDSDLVRYGLTNSPNVVVTNATATGTGSSSLFINKSPTQILADINALLSATWAASGWAVMPDQLRLPPLQFSYLVSNLISTAGSASILEFLKNNSLSNSGNGKPLNIQPVKWLTGRGVGGLDRMFCYTKDEDYVRFPLVPLQRTAPEYRSIYQRVTYWGRLGVVEFVYPETLAYMDGI